MSDKADSVIIGAGFAGLSAAKELLKAGLKPVILEKNPLAGGMASCHRVNDFWIEKFYHHFFTHDDEALSLITELGKSGKLVWNHSRMGFLSDKKLYSFTTPLDLLCFSHVGLLDRIKFGIFSILAKRADDTEKLDSMDTAQWLSKSSLSEAYIKIAEPLIRSKFGVHVDDISAAFLKGRLKARGKSRSSFLSKEQFGYYMGGLEELIEELLNSIEAKGVAVSLGDGVSAIEENGERDFTIRTEAGREIRTSSIISTLPLPLLSKILPGRIDKISKDFSYRSVVCLAISLNKKLSDYYWINVARKKLPFGVIVEHTNLIDPKHYNGERIVYLSRYYGADSPLNNATDDDIFKEFSAGLAEVFPAFDPKKVNWWKVAREAHATPVFTTNFYGLLKDLRSRLPKGLYLAGNLLTYPRSRNVNNVIKSGSFAAEEVIKARG